MKYVELLGRIFFSTIFITAAFGQFTTPEINMASQHGVPMANVLVPFSGLLALSGGLGILLGCRTRLCAGLIALFLIPVTLMMHNFWAVQDLVLRQTQEINFLKNMAMLGGAAIISFFGAGPLSIDAWRRTPKTPEAIQFRNADEMDAAGYPAGTKRAA